MATYDWLIQNALRNKYPNEFALSEADARYIVRAESVFADTAHKYLQLEESELHSDAVQAQIRQDIFDAFKEKRISTARIIKIGESVRRCKYWSYYLTHILIASADNPERVSTYTIESNIDEFDGREFSGSSLQADIETDNPRERARVLGIPDDALYIPHFELSSLRHLWKICKEQDIQLQAKSDFWNIKSSPVLDALSEIGSEALAEREFVDGFTNAYKIKTATGVTITIDASAYADYEQLLKTPNADKLMMQFNHKAIEQGLVSNTVVLTLDEIMEERGLKDRKEAAKTIKAATNLLYAVSVDIEDKTTGSFKRSRIAQEITYTAGKGRKPVATIMYSEPYFKHLQTTQFFLQYPRKLQLIPNNKPNAYIFGKAFATQKRRNIGKDDGIEDKLRVSTLLRRSTLPTYTSLKDKGQVSQLIIKPFIDTLDYLEEQGLFTYQFQYSKSGSNPVELSDVDTYSLYSDFSLFYNLVVKVIWNSEADYEHLLEKKRERRNNAKQSGSKGKRKPVKR